MGITLAMISKTRTQAAEFVASETLAFQTLSIEGNKPSLQGASHAAWQQGR